MFRAIYITILLCFICLHVQAQHESKPFNIGTEYTVHSTYLNEDRPVIVYTPLDYEKDTLQNYPVIYLLDGEWNFHHTSATVGFLANNGRIPEMIIVGIKNTENRTHDLTPGTVQPEPSYPTNGGADSTLNFIQNELFDFVERNYRVNDYKILIGHSFGGLFAIHTLIHHPGIFNSYIAISPSLWWDNQDLVLNQSESFFENNKDLVGHLYMTMGNENNTMVGGAWKLAALLEEKGPPNLKWAFNRMIEETHRSIPFRSTYKGLEFIFKDWNIDHKKEAIMLSGVPVLNHHMSEVKKYYGLESRISENFLRDIAQTFVTDERFEDALKMYEKNTALHPDSWKTNSEYGTVLTKANKIKEAIPYLEKALELNPDDKQALISLRKAGQDVSEFLPDFSYTTNELKAFAGKYESGNGIKLEFYVKDEQLWVRGERTPETELIPLAKNEFFVDMIGAELEFTFNNKVVTGFTAIVDGQKFSATKKE
jgi:predicted alpha/beta superfamily hydrolase